MRPLILNFITDRLASDCSIDYVYDINKSLNIIHVDGEKIPLINFNNEIVNIRTETKAAQESSDFAFNIIEHSIRTKEIGESDNMQKWDV